MDNTMILEIDNKEVIVNVIKMWTMNNIDYIAYTDGNETNGEEDLYVSRYKMIDNTLKLETIDNDDEWNQIDEYLDKNME